MCKYIIVKDTMQKMNRFSLSRRIIEFKIKPIPLQTEPIGWIKDAINEIIAKGTEDLSPGDKVAFSFCSKDFQRGEGWLRFKPVEQITYEDVWNVISSIYQSNSRGFNTESFCLGVTSVKMPVGRGKGGRGRKYNTFEEECGKRRGIIVINNKDNMCLPRALVVAVAYVSKDPEKNNVRRDSRRLQTKRALELCHSAGVDIPKEGCGIPELQQFQRYLKQYSIVVYSYGRKGRDIIFRGAETGATTLNLLHHNGHYNVITSLTAAFCCEYYCETCNIPYDKKNRHRCGGTCPGCQQSPTCSISIKVTCDICKRSFRSEDCYNNHKKSGSHGKSTVCEKITKCMICYKVIKTDRIHTCGEIFCKICNVHVQAEHLCYIKPDNGKPKTNDILFVFYDLETRQEVVQQDESILHEPNLCVFKQCCDQCLTSTNKVCSKCGVKLQVLKCTDPVSPFVHHILTIRRQFKQVVVLAHNGQAFDHQFCLNYILTKTDLAPELIMRGNKIISMIIENVKFLDSLNYFPMALSKLPKAFGLEAKFKKGYFPHLFNTTANTNYTGPLPAMEYYDPDSMKPEDRDKFLAWYEEHKTDEFDMQRDIVDYCISDVEILTAACLKFRRQLLDTGNVCPFTEACTIASACNKVYRRNFLKPNTISIIPKGGYRWRDNQSKIAIQWLVWEEKERNINIIHAAKERESLIQGIRVDGYCEKTNQIFEFLGCYYHGCPACFKHNRNTPIQDDPSQTLDARYEATVSKIDRLRHLGYDVIEMWECQFRRHFQQNDELRSSVDTHPLVTLSPLNPRDAFYGGRTGNTFEYYKCRPREKIKYVDICSLYPWVCKYGNFPVDHPKVIAGEECRQINMNEINGVIKCTILPPEKLYHPVLPLKMNDKLMFVLCRTCGMTLNETVCNHNETERALTGTWIVDEVKKAIEKGYELINVYEIWNYKMEQFSQTSNVTGLFTSMMNKFIKIKQQASGWPSYCVTPNEKNQYIKKFLEREDVSLEYGDILENPGLRSLAKLILNSFWGKFGQRENQPKTKIVKDPVEFFSLLTNPSIYVGGALPINENVLVVNYEYKEEAYDPLTTVNVVIASYVTTQARLKLYSYLEQLEDRVLYYDTDSVVYIHREGEPDIPTGEFIGDMTDELESYGRGSYITEFVSGGPKNYAYKVFSTNHNEERVISKVKGISLNYAASQLVNFDSIKNMVLDTSADSLNVTFKSILRTKEYKVITVNQTKIYKPNSTKRVFLEDHSSVPYGFKRHRNAKASNV